MDRLRLEPGALGKTLGGSARWCAKLDRGGLGEKDLEDRIDQRRLADTGPPVITNTFAARATRMASFWLSASASFVRFSTQGIALSASMLGQGGLPVASSLSFAAISRSAR